MNKVFVYGSLKAGYGNHRLLDKCQMLGPCKLEPKYTMYSLGAFPAVELNGSTAVKGEVYEVNDEVMKRLDGLEGYPTFYDRIQVDTQFGKAWMYYIHNCKENYSDRVVESGEW